MLESFFCFIFPPSPFIISQITISSSDNKDGGILISTFFVFEDLLKIMYIKDINTIKTAAKIRRILLLNPEFLINELYLTLKTIGVEGDFISHKTIIFFPSL